MPHPNKKQRHKAKREAKRHEARRRQSISPLKRLADAKGEAECWISEDFEELGQRQVMVYKQGAELTGVACFLIDRGVVGLKDAWALIGISRAEFSEMLSQTERRDIRMRRSTIDEVRRWIAGGLRWAHDNGMRLPKDWHKTASLIGGVGDWANADVSCFVKEFAGHPDDLRQRLIGAPFEEYLKRSDIDFVFNLSAPYMDQSTGEYLQDGEFLDSDGEPNEDAESLAADIIDSLDDGKLEKLLDRLAPAATALAADTANWMTARGETPSQELLDAWRSVLIGRLLSVSAMPDADEDDLADFGYELLRNLSGRIEPNRFEPYHRAVGQVLEHLATDTSMIQRAVMEHLAADEAKPE